MPLFIKSAGLPARRDTQSVVLLMDLLPTLTDFVLDKKVKNTDGKSFVPQLKNAKKQKKRRVFWYADSARPRNTGESKCAVIREGDFKLLDFYEEGRVELYDLKSDFREEKNLADIESKRVRRMLKKLRKREKRILTKN